ncbi:MAG: hypothetical protein WC647_19140, partial [Desulfomonilaceae bacterium]
WIARLVSFSRAVDYPVGIHHTHSQHAAGRYNTSLILTRYAILWSFYGQSSCKALLFCPC